ECEKSLDGRATCRVVESVKKQMKVCKAGCKCSPCSKTRESGKPVPRVRAKFLVESHGSPKAAALLRTAIGKLGKPSKVERLAAEMEQALTDDGDGALKIDGDVVDHVPADSLRDDLRRKKALKRTMTTPADQEADDEKFPRPVDAWQTSEDDVEGRYV